MVSKSKNVFLKNVFCLFSFYQCSGFSVFPGIIQILTKKTKLLKLIFPSFVRILWVSSEFFPSAAPWYCLEIEVFFDKKNVLGGGGAFLTPDSRIPNSSFDTKSFQVLTSNFLFFSAPIVVARGFLPRFSAYTLFAKRTRVKLLESNPDLDFATLSKEIGDLWAIMSTTEKSNWKKKHARLMKQLLPKGPKLVKHIAHHQAVGLPMRSPILVSGHHNSAVHQPIVAAAHLKLLGESLSVIGQRLTEHNGQIAVSGSLSVLLDALLCAMGPLMCLTKQVPEMNVLPQDKMAKILDNVAYIMPGL